MIPRFGPAQSKLPVRCWLSPPELSPRRWDRFPVTHYEGLIGDLMGMGVPVPGHPAACTRDGCGHAIVRHQHRTRFHQCLMEGCECQALERQEVTR
jgi:hypothetical protein